MINSEKHKQKYVLQTERLALREFILSDADFIIELLNSPGWIEYIGDRNIKTEEQAQDYLLNGPMKSYEINGFGLYGVELKKDNVLIGMCGIIRRDSLDHPDIGFAFLPDFINKGYGFEIADATITYAKDVLKLNPILGITVPHNKSSIKLLEKIGLKFSKMITMPAGSDELMLFSN